MKLELVYPNDRSVLYQLSIAVVMLCNKQPQNLSGRQLSTLTAQSCRVVGQAALLTLAGLPDMSGEWLV